MELGIGPLLIPLIPRLGLMGPPARRRRAGPPGICQPWLKEAVESWCRWRLGTGGAFGTVSASVLALGRCMKVTEKTGVIVEGIAFL